MAWNQIHPPCYPTAVFWVHVNRDEFSIRPTTLCGLFENDFKQKKDPNPNFNSAWNFALRNLVEQLEFFQKIGLTTSTFLVETTSHVTGGFFSPEKHGGFPQVISRTWGDLCMPVCPETGEVVWRFFVRWDWYG